MLRLCGAQAKVQQRKQLLTQMVHQACSAQGKTSEPLTHVDLTHQGVM